MLQKERCWGSQAASRGVYDVGETVSQQGFLLLWIRYWEAPGFPAPWICLTPPELDTVLIQIRNGGTEEPRNFLSDVTC